MVFIVRWYTIGGHDVLLTVPGDMLPPEETSAFVPLNTCYITGDKIYLIHGDAIHFGLGITFAQGKKDDYAAIMVLYRDGQSYAYYPNDSDWLPALRELLLMESDFKVVNLIDMTSHVMQFAVGKSMVTDADISYICNLLLPWINKIRPSTYYSLSWWLIWFYYACIAEENYVSASGARTRLGGLVKMVALIEYIQEGWLLRDACDHYKQEYYYDVYHGEGSIVDAITEKCQQYGIVRIV